MKKILSILLGIVLLIGVSGCSNPDAQKTKLTYEEELNNFFTELQSDAETLGKIQFIVMYQAEHYQLKESDAYQDAEWWNPTINVMVHWSDTLAADEDWYKACSDTKIETLNKAFFNEYKDELSEEHFIPLGIMNTLYFKYVHSEDAVSKSLSEFRADYRVLKRLVNLEYVRYIYIDYCYSMPGVYFDE